MEPGYRKLNEFTETYKFPIPCMEGILNKLDKAQCIAIIGLAKGFHQILVKDEDREMPFGLKNVTPTFQTYELNPKRIYK